MYIYIFFYFFLRRHEQQGLDSTEGWGLCYFGLGYSPLDSQSYVSRNIVMTNQPFSIYHFLELFQRIVFPISVYTMKSLSIIPMHVVFPQLPFIFSSPENC